MQGQASNENVIEGSLETSVIVGVTPTIVIGDVTTIEPNQKAKVTLDPNSTKLVPILNFAIPRGKQGERGIQGDRGEQGKTGAQGERGDTGEKGDKGDKGDTGEDAYTAAQNGGYAGTQDEFYQSLASIGNINAVLDEINGEVV